MEVRFFPIGPNQKEEEMSYYLPYDFDLDEAYEDGYEDYLSGFDHYYDNPFTDEDLAYEWEEGWFDAAFDHRNRY